MSDRETKHRRLLLIGCILAAAVAVLLGAGVIPPVLADTYENASPGRAANAFGVSLAFHLIAAAILFWMYRRRSRGRTVTYILAALLVMVLGLALTDAGSSFQNHGPAMRTASLFMYLGAGADGVTVAMVIVALFFRPVAEKATE